MEQRTIQTQESAERIDALLARSLPELTRSAAQRLLAQGAVTKDGAPVKKNYKTAPGDTFVVTLPDAAPSALVAQDLPLDVVYEDDDLIVVNKPRGMVVHPAPGHEDGTLVNALLAHCGDSLSGVGGERRPGIVHRIDKDTSGLLVAAKNDFAHLALSAQLADHTMARTYEAVVCGNLREDAGTVDAPIGRHPTDRKRMAVTPKNARRAVEAVQALPLDRILIETDCPYMAPEPYRGRRNDSRYVPLVAAKIAALRGLTPEEAGVLTAANARRLFRIPDGEEASACVTP